MKQLHAGKLRRKQTETKIIKVHTETGKTTINQVQNQRYKQTGKQASKRIPRTSTTYTHKQTNAQTRVKN